MALRIQVKPITQTFKLERADPTGETTVTIRQVRTGDLVRLGNLFADQTQIWNDDDVGVVRLQKKWNPQELMRERAFCTLVACDIEDDETGELIFRSREGKNGIELAMGRNDFHRSWDALPFHISEEIYEQIVAVNPIWNPAAQGE